MVLDETDSTNAEAMRQAPTLAQPTWILALNQTAARGRRGRAWANPKGNFSATLVMHPSEPAETVALRSFVAALAVSDALVAVIGRAEPLALKWPNDVLLNGGKLAGILLESQGHGTSVRHLAIGIGINLASAPDVATLEHRAMRPVSLAGETGIDIDPRNFLSILAPIYADLDRQLTTYGFEPVRTAWLARASRLGQPITARTASEDVTGIFESVDGSGALVLKTPQSRRAIPAAEVYF